MAEIRHEMKVQLAKQSQAVHRQLTQAQGVYKSQQSESDSDSLPPFKAEEIDGKLDEHREELDIISGEVQKLNSDMRAEFEKIKIQLGNATEPRSADQ